MQTPYWLDDIEAARRAVVEIDPALARAHAQTPAFDWRRRVGGFEGLFHMIVDQQVSLASAAAIWSRVVEGVGGVVTSELTLATYI